MCAVSSFSWRFFPPAAQAILWILPATTVITEMVVPSLSFAQQASTPGTDLNAVPLPEIRVIATTPVAPPRRAPPAAATSRGAAAPVAQTATATEPGVVDLDKIPSNVQTISATDFAPTKAPDLLQ